MENKLTTANKVAYGFSDFGNNLVFVAATNYLMFYYTDVAGLSLAATGILFLIVRIFDAFAGPIFGILVDKTQTRFVKSDHGSCGWPFLMPYQLFCCSR